MVQQEKGLAREFSLHSPCKRKQLTAVYHMNVEPYRIERMHERISSYFSEYRDIRDFFRGSRLVRIGVGRSHGYGACNGRAGAVVVLYSVVLVRIQGSTPSYRVPPCTLSFLSLIVRFTALYESQGELSLLFPSPQHLHGCFVSFFLYFLELPPLQSSVLPSMAP